MPGRVSDSLDHHPWPIPLDHPCLYETHDPTPPNPLGRAYLGIEVGPRFHLDTGDQSASAV